MKSKKIIIILCVTIILVSLIFISCKKENQEKFKDGELTKIIELEEKDPPNIISSEWVSFNEEERIKMSDLIFSGKVVEKKEYVIETEVSEEFTRKNYKTVYSIGIKKIYYSSDKDIKVDDVVKVLSPITSYNWEPDAVDMKIGQEYILFTRLSMDTDKMKNTDLAKYSLGNPWEPIIVVKENSFEMDEVFSSLIGKASSEERITYDNQTKKVYIRQDENFITDLKDLISKYKNK